MKSCKGCKYLHMDITENDDNPCDDCSRLTNLDCSCHINPPCSACVNDHYDEEIETIEVKE